MQPRQFSPTCFSLLLAGALTLTHPALAQSPPEAPPPPPEAPEAPEAPQTPEPAPEPAPQATPDVAPPPAPVADGAFDQVIAAARERAAAPYANADVPLPPALATLEYDAHRDIRCLPENFLWYGSTDPFRVQFRHRGWVFKDEVLLSTVAARDHKVTPLPFSPNRFTYGPIATAALGDPQSLPRDLGYAGIALHRVAFEQVDGQTKEAYNEIMSIQGGSYFRAVGDGQHWGSSVRGIAIDTALPEGEEFPRWVELWVRQPLPGDEHITLYGLMDGPSVSGAFKLVVNPGPTLTVDVDARLFFRSSVGKLGLAPITSMFLFGEDNPARFNDYRPEVHDADALVLHHANGDIDTRPLRNPAHHLSVSRFKMTDPRGFGLVQRDRDFANYQDLETEMQIRPSVWITPKVGFGEGWVELLEIASNDEGIDNIGAYWVPADEALAQPGVEHALSYRIDFTQDPRPMDSPIIRWTDTRTLASHSSEEGVGSVVRTAADTAEDAPAGHVLRVLLDTHKGSALPNGTIVRADVKVARGKLVGEPIVQYNRFADAYRLFFDVEAEGPEPLELRATLRGAEGQALTETWVYRWDLP